MLLTKFVGVYASKQSTYCGACVRNRNQIERETFIYTYENAAGIDICQDLHLVSDVTGLQGHIYTHRIESKVCNKTSRTVDTVRAGLERLQIDEWARAPFWR